MYPDGPDGRGQAVYQEINNKYKSHSQVEYKHGGSDSTDDQFIDRHREAWFFLGKVHGPL
jgi:hypothetical protein